MIKIVDNFYDNPDEIREIAIKAKYQLISSGNYSGHDTIDRHITFPGFIEKITSIFPYSIVASRFRKTLEGDTHMSYIHADATTRNFGWHVLVYLTKEPVEDGLNIYEHVKYGKWATKESKEIMVSDTLDFSKFKLINHIPYKYNRAVIIDYSQWHAPMHHTGFGDCIQNCRLMHIIEIQDKSKEDPL